jgi:hypothetical protein
MPAWLFGILLAVAFGTRVGRAILFSLVTLVFLHMVFAALGMPIIDTSPGYYATRDGTLAMVLWVVLAVVFWWLGN